MADSRLDRIRDAVAAALGRRRPGDRRALDDDTREGLDELGTTRGMVARPDPVRPEDGDDR